MWRLEMGRFIDSRPGPGTADGFQLRFTTPATSHPSHPSADQPTPTYIQTCKRCLTVFGSY